MESLPSTRFVAPGDETIPVIGSAVYTPFLRVALSAKVPRAAGRILQVGNVTPDHVRSIIRVI